jgi:hypothetical protein
VESTQGTLRFDLSLGAKILLREGLTVVDPGKASRAIVPVGPDDLAKPRAETSSHSVEAHGMTIEPTEN